LALSIRIPCQIVYKDDQILFLLLFPLLIFKLIRDQILSLLFFFQVQKKLKRVVFPLAKLSAGVFRFKNIVPPPFIIWTIK
jgi:hypothetical protein